MVDEILKFTKLTFLIHTILAVFSGIQYLIPATMLPIYGITVTPMISALSMIIGAVFMGLAVMSLCGYMAKEWKEVKIVVIGEIVWLIIGIIAGIISAAANIALITLAVVILIIFLVLFVLAFLQQEEKIKPLLK
jgi:uncharacterized membrane-anchored protein